ILSSNSIQKPRRAVLLYAGPRREDRTSFSVSPQTGGKKTRQNLKQRSESHHRDKNYHQELSQYPPYLLRQTQLLRPHQEEPSIARSWLQSQNQLKSFRILLDSILVYIPQLLLLQ